MTGALGQALTDGHFNLQTDLTAAAVGAAQGAFLGAVLDPETGVTLGAALAIGAAAGAISDFATQALNGDGKINAGEVIGAGIGGAAGGAVGLGFSRLLLSGAGGAFGSLGAKVGANVLAGEFLLPFATISQLIGHQNSPGDILVTAKRSTGRLQRVSVPAPPAGNGPKVTSLGGVSAGGSGTPSFGSSVNLNPGLFQGGFFPGGGVRGTGTVGPPTFYYPDAD